MDSEQQQAVATLKTFSPTDLAPAFWESVKDLSAKEKKEVVRQFNQAATNGGIVGPGQETSDKLWTIVVWAFAIVLVGAFLALAIGVFAPIQGDKGVKPELILTTFTSVVGFLAGLFTPSPVAKKPDSNE
jgi:fatty acid desaturase